MSIAGVGTDAWHGTHDRANIAVYWNVMDRICDTVVGHVDRRLTAKVGPELRERIMRYDRLAPRQRAAEELIQDVMEEGYDQAV